MKYITIPLLLVFSFFLIIPQKVFANGSDITVSYSINIKQCTNNDDFGGDQIYPLVPLADVECRASCRTTVHSGVSDSNGLCTVTFSANECAIGDVIYRESGACPCGVHTIGCQAYRDSAESIPVTSPTQSYMIFAYPVTNVPEYGILTSSVAGLVSLGGYVFLRFKH